MRRCDYDAFTIDSCPLYTVSLNDKGYGWCRHEAYTEDVIEDEPNEYFYICTLPEEAWKGV